MSNEAKEHYFDHYETLEDALATAIRMSNLEPKQVAMILWPNVPPQTAYSRLMDALSPSKPQKLSLYEILNIMRACNRFDPLYWLEDQCLHERSKKKTITREVEDICRSIEERYQEMDKSYRSFTRLVETYAENKKINEKLTHISDVKKTNEK